MAVEWHRTGTWIWSGTLQLQRAWPAFGLGNEVQNFADGLLLGES